MTVCAPLDALIAWGGGVAGEQVPVVDDGQALAQGLGLVEVVGGQHHGLAGLMQACDDLPEVVACLRVDARGGFVEEEHLRQVHQGPADHDAAGLAAGELVSFGVGLVGEAELFQQFERAAAGGWGRHAEVAAAEGQVVRDCERAVQGVGLGDHADAGLHADRVGTHLVLGDPRLSGAGRDQGGEHADGGGLPEQCMAA
ncbi:hypothetical protein GCM10010246_05320 [Streptomyces cuspidosporus]|uniref:Uncharacterized protein n=1 Tax=Streptomyces cuspidosporus TaxID=66882 RepID=A0ABP5S8H5_9ACTN